MYDRRKNVFFQGHLSLAQAYYHHSTPMKDQSNDTKADRYYSIFRRKRRSDAVPSTQKQAEGLFGRTPFTGAPAKNQPTN